MKRLLLPVFVTVPALVGLVLAAPTDQLVRIGVLAAGTLVSEDLTCIAAGQLAGSGKLSPLVAVFGCFAGIYVGDLGLWLGGRLLGRRALRVPALARRLPAERLNRFGEWFDRSSAAAIVAARFLPGTRLPLYVAAGTLGRKGGRFALWTFVAAALWTPPLVLLVALFGDTVVRPFRLMLGNGWAVLAGVVVLFGFLRAATLAATPIGRAKLIAKVSRLWRWEFWPTWLFYAPLAPWIAYQSIRRGGLHGFASVTAANPGMPHGGFVGESKFQILSSLSPCHVLSAALIGPGPITKRLKQLDVAARERGWSFPLILKPDVGQRGVGVKLARGRADVEQYFRSREDAVVAQRFHPGPYEAGVFYYRFPGEAAGRIYSITDKHFPEIAGDGKSTVEELIWSHPRYRMQARLFLARHSRQLNRVLAAGECLRLAVAGNHCQGTLFRDGAHLITPQLEAKIDWIAKSFDGFYFGRFDIRYSNVEAFTAGEDLAIIEVNGVTSESTNIYDPDHSLMTAYRTLIEQWRILFRVADENVHQGHQPTRPAELWTLICAHTRRTTISSLSD